MQRALIIEDDADQREILALFVREAGWEVVEAETGEAGIDAALSNPPDVVFCDLLMQGVNGFHVCRKLRETPALRETHIVVTSGRAFEEDRLAALESGANDYLQKPINFSKIGELLNSLSQPSRQPTGPQETPSNTDKDSGTLIRFWGVRGSIPTPGPDTLHFGGNTSCVEIHADGERIILDAGTGMRALGRELMQQSAGHPLELSLLLSHTHWDHIQGLPYFAPLYEPTTRIRVFGYEGARSGLATILSSQMESPFFPVGLADVASDLQIHEQSEMRFALGPVQVETCFANHPGICVGYRLSTSAGSIVYLPDNEPPVRQQQSRASAGQPADSSADFAKSEQARLQTFLKDADVLIMDAQYTEEEYRQHVGWGHGCIDDVVELAVMANVGRLFLFHHDPDHDDDDVRAMEAHAREQVTRLNGRVIVEAAREGLQVPLPQTA